MLMVGNHPRDGFASIYPNPNAEPETSRTWEVGANTIFQDVALDGDSLSLKAGYFDTRADNYLFRPWTSFCPAPTWKDCHCPAQQPSSITATAQSSADWNLKGVMRLAGSMGGELYPLSRRPQQVLRRPLLPGVWRKQIRPPECRWKLSGRASESPRARV
ncbi:TonB-dependent receptor [Achromobacter xylosoxidans]